MAAAKKQRARVEAKQKSTEHTTASLIQDEEEAAFSEPDPVSTTALATSLASQADVEELKEVTQLNLGVVTWAPTACPSCSATIALSCSCESCNHHLAFVPFLWKNHTRRHLKKSAA